MLKKYKVKGLDSEVSIIAVEDIKSLVKDGFIIIQMKTMSPDTVEDFVETLGLADLPFPAIVTDSSITVWEVLEEKEKENAKS